MKTAKSFMALLVFCFLPLAGVAAEAAGAASEHHGLPLYAADIAQIHGFVISNSMVVTWIVALGLIVCVQIATRRMKAVPTGAQNFWEWVVESLYGFLESIIGPELVKKTFWLFATIFIFVLASSWFSLLPGVGSIGWGDRGPDGFELKSALLRGSTADLNMTLAMAMIFFCCWIVWAWQTQGPIGVLLHLFGPKGDNKGLTQLLMIVVFIAVGFLEIISILFRPVSLSLRLFGNMYAGEDMLEIMTAMVPALSWLLPLPIYFMEILVGFVQALVFMLLTAVFTLLICQHEEHPVSTSH